VSRSIQAEKGNTAEGINSSDAVSQQQHPDLVLLLRLMRWVLLVAGRRKAFPWENKMACGGGGKSEHCPELVDIVAGSAVIHDEQGGGVCFIMSASYFPP
jgi:hypothetical protein